MRKALGVTGTAVFLWTIAQAHAQGPASPSPDPTPSPPPTAREIELEKRLQRLEELNQRILERYEDLSKKYDELSNRIAQDGDRAPQGSPSSARTDAGSRSTGPLGDVPPGTDLAEIGPEGETPPEPETEKAEGRKPSRFHVDYDEGFVIASDDEEKFPYLLRINGRMQFRHVGFSRSERFWFNSAGDRIEIRNRNDFEIERGRLTFSGFFLDPKLQFFMNFDFDTDDEDVTIIHDFWVNYKFSEAFDLHFGKAFVPGSREWLEGSTRTQLADRSLATTFFRPDRSVGIWALGEPVKDFYYRAMIANGFNTTGLTSEDIDPNFAFAGSVWWDIFGNFGAGYPDLEWHEKLAIQAGNSFTSALRNGPGPLGAPLIEQNFVRLSDGTRLTLPGALAPGVTVNQFDIYLYALDLAAKYRGFSISGEYYLRWIQGIEGFGGPLPFTTMFDHGFFVQGGYFVIPKKFEVVGRTSQIWGPFGTGEEYAGGFNWYVNGTHSWKWTFDVSRIIGSPAQNAAPDYRAGDTGVLFRTQFQAAF